MGYVGERKREYQREWMRRRREDFFANKSCVRCGSTDRLELDHIDRATKVDHKIWSWSKARQEKELAKCQVLCYDCHKVKTKTEFTITEHGTRAQYRNHGCKCAECRAHNTNTKRAWRNKQTQ